MSMQGIDVSNWKSGVDVTKSQDFVIVQTTWGAGGMTSANLSNGVSTIADAQYQAAKNAGKRRAFMHYYCGGDVNAEAQFFVDNTKGYHGDGIPMVDWEEQDNPYVNNGGVFKALLQAITDRMGGPGIAYFQASLYWMLKPICDELNWGTFVAEYANMSVTGWQDSPWNEGAYACTMRQYTSMGSIGAGDYVDLDIFYGDGSMWDAYVQGSVGAAESPSNEEHTDEQLADAVLAGKLGDGDNRRAALGDRYDAVQAIVDARLGGNQAPAQPDLNALADAVIRGDYGDGDDRRNRLGSNYDAVQAIVDQRMASQAPAEEYYTVQPGDSLSVIGDAFGKTWQDLAQMNNISNPDYIQAGQVLRVR